MTALPKERFALHGRRLVLAASAALFAVGACAQVTTTVSVGGTVEHALTLSVDDLKRFPIRRVDEVRAVRDASTKEEQVGDHVGVLLRDVLDRAKIVESARHDLRRSIVVATASNLWTIARAALH